MGKGESPVRNKIMNMVNAASFEAFAIFMKTARNCNSFQMSNIFKLNTEDVKRNHTFDIFKVVKRWLLSLLVTVVAYKNRQALSPLELWGS